MWAKWGHFNIAMHVVPEDPMQPSNPAKACNFDKSVILILEFGSVTHLEHRIVLPHSKNDPWILCLCQLKHH